MIPNDTEGELKLKCHSNKFSWIKYHFLKYNPNFFIPDSCFSSNICVSLLSNLFWSSCLGSWKVCTGLLHDNTKPRYIPMLLPSWVLSSTNHCNKNFPFLSSFYFATLYCFSSLFNNMFQRDCFLQSPFQYPTSFI